MGVVADVAEYMTHGTGKYNDTLFSFHAAVSETAGVDNVDDPDVFRAAIVRHWEHILHLVASDERGGYDMAKLAAIRGLLDFLGIDGEHLPVPKVLAYKRVVPLRLVRNRLTLAATLKAATITHQQRLIRVLMARRADLQGMEEAMLAFERVWRR